MRRVLFLYATSNSGHQRAAEAIQKSLLKIRPGTSTEGIDFFTYYYPTMGPFLFRMYLELMQSMPHTWDYLYDSPDVATHTSELRRFFNFLNIPKIHQLLQRYDPDVIVCTQAVPAGFVAAEKQKGRINVPHLVTITDFVANPYWPNHSVDSYFIPSEEIRAELAERDIPADRIHVTGIPIDDSFCEALPKAVARRKTGLRDDLPTVLVMGGSHGLGQMADAIKSLASCGRPIQVIVVTGCNKSLYNQLAKKYGDRQDILVLGRVKNISRLMDAADLLVSKPGGLTSTEAITKGLPMVIVSPLPGQEERNAAYLTRHGTAARCFDLATLPDMVLDLVDAPEKLEALRERTVALRRSCAGEEIARQIARYL